MSGPVPPAHAFSPDADPAHLLGLAAQAGGVPIVLMVGEAQREPVLYSRSPLEALQAEQLTTLCTSALDGQGVKVVCDLTDDPAFAALAAVTGAPHLRFWAGCPLFTADGRRLGTLHLLDLQPRPEFSSRERQALEALTALVVHALGVRDQALEGEREVKALTLKVQMLEEELKHAQLLQAISDLTDLDLEPGELLSHVAELTSTTLGVDWGGLATLSQGVATCQSTWCSPAGEAFARQAPRGLLRGKGGLLWRAASQSAPLFISSVEARPKGGVELPARVRSAVSVSLGQKGTVTYVMTLLRLGKEREWTPRDRHLVEVVSRAVRQSLTRAAHRAAVRRAEEQLRLALEAAPVVLWATDMTGVFTASLGRRANVPGLDPERVVGQSVDQVFGRHPTIVQNVKRALAGESFSAHVAIGDQVFECHYAPLQDHEGQQVGAVGTGYDVTEALRHPPHQPWAGDQTGA